MKLKNHRIDGVPYTRAKRIGQTITPKIVVLHDTASRLEEGSAARYLLDNVAKTSVHFVIERSGNVVQQVPTNKRANHAGESHYHGEDGCNNFSIGIEIVNPGRLIAAGRGAAMTWFKELYDRIEDEIHDITTPEHGRGLWMDYTHEQIISLMSLLEALFVGIPSLRDITTHWYISPGRKFDTNPLFPLEAIRAKILGRDDPAELDAVEQSHPDMRTQLVAIKTPGGSALNMRRWPSFNPNVIGRIPDGTLVPVTRTGVFAGRPWHRVIYDGREGWVVQSYTAPITQQ